MIRAALYIRVSTDDQLEFSPDAQKRALVEYSKKNDMLVSDEYIFIDEGITGTSVTKRKAFQKMIATAKKRPKPFDVILVHKFDRFARSREDSVVYKSLLRKECGIKVVSITEQLEDDKFSVILEAMLEAMGEYYSLNLSDEVMKGMSEKARKGGIQANAPYGYRLEKGNYIVVDEEAKIVKLMYEKAANGEGLTRICREIFNMGIRTKNGARWIPKRVKYIIQNPVYTGKLRWNYTTHKDGRKINDAEDWIIVDGDHTPIIDNELFNKANKQIDLASNVVDKRPINATMKHWLSGLLRCSSCGGTLIYIERKRKKVENCKSYRCNQYNKGACNTTNHIRIEDAEKEVKRALKMHIKYAETNELGKMANIFIKKPSIDEKELLDSQLKKVKAKYTMAKDAYFAQIDTLEEYKENKANIALEEKNILDKLNNLKNNTTNIEPIKNKLMTAIDLLEDENTSIEDKNKFLKSFIDKIVVDVSLDTLSIYYYI